MSQRPHLNESQWDFLCKELDNLHLMAEERGFRTAYHHHMGTVCQSAEDIYTLMNGTERIGLLYDTGHLAPAGADCLEVLKNHWQRISHVHFKNIRKSVLWQSMQRNDSFHQLLLNGGFTCPGDDGYDNADYTYWKAVENTLLGISL